MRVRLLVVYGRIQFSASDCTEVSDTLFASPATYGH